MDKKVIRVPHQFFSESSYTENIRKEKEDDSYGLIFNDFAHDLGSMLGVDIIWNKLNNKETMWQIANDKNLEIILDETVKENESFVFVPRTTEGQKRIEEMMSNLKTEFGEDFSIDNL